jgi:stearoyl-CoA desaturase (delta-9 desaturase)
VLVPLLGVVTAPLLLWGWGFGWVEFGLLLGMYILTALGVTVGFHRLFTHRSFETNPVIRFVLAALGSMAVEGSVLKWAALHRRHHQHSDTPDDPHTPHHQGRGLWGVIRGFWHAHIGWAFKADTADLERYVKDLRQSTCVRVASALFPLWIVAGLAIPAILGGILSSSWLGVLLGFVWGGLVRVFLVHHVTWSVNSVCHLWGTRPYPERDHSRNNLVLGILALGEGWHNNHHAFPTSARHGLRWWQIDVSYYVILLLALLRLAWKIRLPDRRVT